MNIEQLYTPEAQDFLHRYKDAEVEEVLLQKHKYPTLDVSFLVSQMEGKRKALKKLPSWASNDKIIFPSKLSMEQCSSEQTALYKSSLMEAKSIVDLTGGFGVDTWAFAQKAHKVVYVEQNKDLASIVAHNISVRGLQNIEVYPLRAEEFLQQNSESVDLLYIDPARRKEGNKVFRFTDCEPNIPSLLPSLFSKSEYILIKTSPLLDITQALEELSHVKEVHVVAVENECKELLFLLHAKSINDASIKMVAVNFSKQNRVEQLEYQKEEEQVASVPLSNPLRFLYEPNAAILKVGAFKTVALRYGISKLHPHSHLYTSDLLVENFPGRVFQIERVLPYSKKELIEAIPSKSANITTRNFPDSVAGIRQKTGLKDGGDIYLFATTINLKPSIVLTKKLTTV